MKKEKTSSKFAVRLLCIILAVLMVCGIATYLVYAIAGIL